MDRIPLSCSSLTALLLAHAAAAPAAAQGTPVDLELVLAVDVSGSMDPDEHAIQRRGYVEAFTHPDVVGAIRSGPFGRVAVAYVEWGGPASQAVTVPWTLVEDLDTAADFAAGLGEASLGRFRGTSISGALTFSAPLFEGNGFDGLRRVIDVSGDGPNNAGAPVVPARDAAVEGGIVVNGLPIALKVPGFSGIGGSDLVAYYRECVIGGPGAFVIPVTEAGQLAEAIRQKLVLEIAGLPARPVPAAQWQPVQAARSIDCLIGERLRRVWERDP
jgi:Protein of unknown function (DUF1194)